MTEAILRRLDVRDYVGLPYAPVGRDRRGVDCWGLVRMVLWERLGIDLPSFSYDVDHEDAANVSDRAELIAHQAEELADPVLTVEGDGSRTHHGRGIERPGDVVVLRAQGEPIHVGLVVEPGLMLHIHAECEAGSTVESYRGVGWKGRLIGIYRLRAIA